ncbi:MAG: Uma2 family endonuclease [Chloroflexota bacterium]
MDVQEKLYTVAEYWEVTQQPENEGKRLELVEGVIIEMPPSSRLNTIIAMRIGHFLSSHVIEPRDVRIPDAAFIAKERVPELAGTTFPAAPDLAVEVVSPSETPRSVLDKARAYLAAGTRLVWVVYPEERVVDVHRLSEDGSMNIQTIDAAGTLDGEDVLPGLTLRVRDVFPEAPAQ